MLRRTGRAGSILRLRVPIESTGLFRRKAVVKIDVRVEAIKDGCVTLVVAEPTLDQ